MGPGLIVPTAIITLLYLNLGITIGVMAAEVDTVTRLKEQYGVCTTPGCVQAASMLSSYLDTSVEPCDDFHKFFCGGYATPGKSAMEKVRIILEEPSPPTEPKPFRLVNNLYRACMESNITAVETKNRTFDDLKKAGGWPLREGSTWKSERFDWIQSLYTLKDLGYFSDQFFALDSTVDFLDPTTWIVFVYEFLTQNIEDSINDMLQYSATGKASESEVAKQDVTALVEFMRQLQNITADSELKNAFHRITIAELSESCPEFPWLEFINHFQPRIQVNESDVISIYSPPITFCRHLKLFEETPKRIQANFIMWNALLESIGYLRNSMVSQKCADQAAMKLPSAIGAMYVRKHLSKETKRDAVEMMDLIKKQFKQILLKNDWMDNNTRKKAEKKLARMTGKMAYPEEILDDRILEDYFKDLEVNDENYLQGIHNITLFNTAKWLSDLEKRFNKSDWTIYENVLTSDPLYMLPIDVIHIPAVAFDVDVASDDVPMYIKYGTLGVTIGQVLMSAFQYVNESFDGQENTIDEPSSAAKYWEKVQCLIDQYGNYSVEEVGRNLDGEAVSKRILLTTGLKLAYLAYNDWSTRNGPEQLLLDLPYTPKQMFWITVATAYCSDPNDETSRLQILTNSQEFSNDFDCPIGSIMNPNEKCTVW